MAKAILISIRPNWVKEILNGEKTIEIRKRFPKDYVGWVYIYCTKGGDMICYRPNFDGYACVPNLYGNEYFNGKVVARFWCDKVEDYVNGHKWSWENGAPMWGACNDYEYILKPSCLTKDELYDYCEDLSFKAIHITKLEIFDKPKEISEFYKVGYENSVIATKKYILNSMNREERRRYKTELDLKINNEIAVIKDNYKLTRAPQSWFYIEV